MRQAKRALEYQTMKHYFPNELAMLEKLGRRDIVDPDMDPQLKQPSLYRINGPSFIRQLFAIIERKHPSIAPLSWTLTRAPETDNKMYKEKRNRGKSRKECSFDRNDAEGYNDNDVNDNNDEDGNR